MNETLLLVEDEPILREMNVMVLSGLGYHVLPAGNGVQALDLVEEHREWDIHLLITDVLMPQMGGLELAKRLRAFSPRTKVLFCSGHSEATVMHNANAGGFSFMEKPYSVATLTNKVRELLEKAA
jgi:two-component system cell cycle sensor histidine kinase/response regulator CckA